ncbi:MAG: tRNA lysidine(34) synthetase TilS [Gammaproteobacteria bacterium]|nr:tRNA lysidine(34) synthetase TilS [Gammaproteobacteria bacterium]
MSFLSPSSFHLILQNLLAGRDQAEPVSGYLLALSGGLDSVVLLDLLAGTPLDAPLRAIYIDHGLQADSARWGEFCLQQCQQRHISCEVVPVQVRQEAGHGPEDSARRARYAALAQRMLPGEVLLTAQHQDDQAETLLLQLLRGGGPRGLAAMPAINAFGPGWQLRPLLDFSRAQLQHYAADHSLAWVEDPSNADSRYDRNFLRQQVIPLLKQRWPSMAATLSRSARLCAEAADLLAWQAQVDLVGVRQGETLSVAALVSLPEPRRKQVLLEWIGQSRCPLPSERQLQHILHDLLTSAEDAEPCVRWGGVQMRRFQGQLYLLPQENEPLQIKVWDLTQPLTWGGRQLVSKKMPGRGLSLAKLQGAISVRPRQGGESLRLPGRDHHHSLKKLLQAAGLPPWERQQLALLFVDEQLAAVVGHWISADFAADHNEAGLIVELASLS